MMDLEQIRAEIDKANRNIVGVFEDRMDLVGDVAQYKIDNNIKILDRQRERDIIKSMLQHVHNEKHKPFVAQFLENLMMLSRKMQHDIIKENVNVTIDEPTIDSKNPTVAYLGLPGSFSEIAVVEYFGDSTSNQSTKSFSQIIKGVENGRYDMAMIPVENSSTGSVNQAVDLLIDHDVQIIGEHIVHVRHFLLGLKGCDMNDIKTVVSHPQPIEQCREFIDDNSLLAVPFESTASAAKHVMQSNDVSLAAIASKRSADIYHLDIIKEDIQTNNSNYTRFVVLSKNTDNKDDADKISLICTIDHKPGSLHNLIDIFSRHQLNLLQLFSRPIHNMPWKYRFHLDFAGNMNDKNVLDALEEAQNYCISLKVLGNYKSWSSQDA
ncbi:MAG: prephenate dehydratase [Clostridiales bacterium]|nr:prephenate dehydratase [Clostridiales bacterium]